MISRPYKARQEEANFPNLGVKLKWELEANIKMEDEAWKETFRAGHKLTTSPTWREFEWKVTM